MNFIKYNEYYLSEQTTNSMEQYFKNKIDWKTFNYLLDKITKYEDIGHVISIRICLCDHNSNDYCISIYNYSKSIGNGYTDRADSAWYLIDLYNKDSEFYYKILLCDSDDVENENIIHEIIEDVKSKFKVFKTEEKILTLILK